MADGLSWFQVVSLALGSSVVGSIITQLFTAWREAKREKVEEQKKRRDAAFLALRLATTFEEYARSASTIISELQVDEATHGYDGNFTSKLPVLSELPTADEAWRDLPSSLQSKVLGFPQYVFSAQSSIYDFINYVGGPEVHDHMRIECAKIGTRALDVAGELRTSFELPELETPYDWPRHLRRASK